jgi:hypothetical protein
VRAVVPGDVMRLSAGDLVPADARLIEARDRVIRVVVHRLGQNLRDRALPIADDDLFARPYFPQVMRQAVPEAVLAVRPYCRVAGGAAGAGTIDAGSGQFPSYGGQFGTASSGAG